MACWSDTRFFRSTKMTVFRNVMVYLGFGPDEEYDDNSYFLDDHYDGGEDDRDVVRRVPGGRRPANGSGPRGRHEVDEYDDFLDESPTGKVHSLQPADDWDETPEERNVRVRRVSEEIDLRSMGERPSERRAAPAGSGRNGGTRGRSDGALSLASRAERLQRDPGPAVRAVPMRRMKPVTVVPDSFADAKEIADEFGDGVAVIMNLQGLNRELARRLIDFASGVCYAQGGSMEKIASQVFLLTPDAVELSDDERLEIRQGLERV